MIENIAVNLNWKDFHDLALHCSQTGQKDVARTLFAAAYKQCSDDDSRLQCASGFANVLKNGEADEWRIGIKYEQAQKTQDYRDFVNLTNCYIGAVKLHEAFISASKALELSGTRNADTWMTLGSVHALIGELEKAANCMKNAKTLNPEFSPYYALQTAANVSIENNYDEVFWKQFYDNYSFRKKGAPSLNVLEHDLTNKHVLVAMEQGIGDAVMMRRAIHWLSGRCKRLTLYCSAKYEEFYGAFVWSDTCTDPAAPRDVAVNLMDLLVAVNYWIYFPTPKPWLEFRKDWKSSFDYRTLVNFEGSQEFPFEHIRGIYDERVRKAILEEVSWPVTINEKTCSLADLPIYLNRVSSVITTDTMIANLSGEMGKRTLVLLHPGHDWRWNFNFYSSVTKAVSKCTGMWDTFTVNGSKIPLKTLIQKWNDKEL